MPQAPNLSSPAAPVVLVDNTGTYISQPTAANPNLTRTVGSPNINTGQIPVGTSSTLVVAARSGRHAVTITSTAAVVFYVGVNGVTASTGQYVAAAAGASVTIATSAAVYAVGASAVTVSYLETF